MKTTLIELEQARRLEACRLENKRLSEQAALFYAEAPVSGEWQRIEKRYEASLDASNQQFFEAKRLLLLEDAVA